MYQLVRSPRQHVVLIHGEGVGPWVWAPFAGALPAEVEVHRPTLPGHPPTSTDFCSPASAAEAVAAQVGLDDLPGEVTVVGTSVGGQVAIELARAFPYAISRVVAIGSPVEPHPAAPLAEALSTFSRPLSLLATRSTRRRAQLQASLTDSTACTDISQQMSPTTAARLVTSRFGYRCSPVPEDVPVLLVSGTRDSQRLKSGHARLAGLHPQVRSVQLGGPSLASPTARPRELAAAVTRWAQIGQNV